MRKKLLLITAMLSILTVVGFRTVSASTDCDRWLQQYKEQLANYTPVRHVRRHIHHLLHRTAPRPRLLNAYIPIPRRYLKPKLSPQEMLRRFHILCGDLPPEEESFTPALLVLPPSPPPAFAELTSAEVPPSPTSPPIANTTPVDYATGPNGPVAPVGPIFPSGPVGPSVPFIPSGPGGSTGTTGTTGPVSPVVPPVPEPSSLLLLLTGLAGIVAVTSRK
jgi:hypothetical protein